MTLAADIRQRLPGALGMTADSRQVRPGDLFLAMPGEVHDGRQHIPAAVAAGAAGIVWEPEGHAWPAGVDLPNWPVAGLKQQAAGLAAEWWGRPSEKLWMIGITGTNGKTSCSHWLAEGLSRLERRTAVIGTLGNGFPEQLAGASHTTPDAVTLQGLLAGYRDAGAAGVAMEVSSHALDQGRVEGVRFDVAVLTNLSRDHLDYHGDMVSYAHAKARLFDWPGLKWALLNLEDALGQRLYADLAGRSVQRLGYGFTAGEIRGSDLRLSADGLAMTVATPWGRGELHAPLMGRFNADNLLACLAALLASEVPLEDALRVLSGMKPAPGRMQKVPAPAGAPAVVVDYAHTPDALEKALATLRPLADRRLICVFGCGGGRDKGKRPLMGETAARLADVAIVTSDNPRNEDPETIIAEIRAGMTGQEHVESDRARAIAGAIAMAGAGDVVLIAGKGHEDYQESQGERRWFSDVAEAEKNLKEYQHASA
ncbi:MAG: UDP-N-acetylmuramoyl-L-alanyl-D-glutamate--2,6-diaminopimelate ligase [Gallionellaceae bacterium]|nr:UDP-N-acetylmuramoyl-L-alanyl-D-glutamate--2,6-diaminopimelate ligase [Gallionellaceae bacterium]